jgi:hypothetical protein
VVDQNAVRDAAADDLNAALTPWREKYGTVDLQALTGRGMASRGGRDC